MHNTRHPDLTYTPAASTPQVKPAPMTMQHLPANTQQTNTTTSTNAPFNYKVELKCITHKIKTNLKAKFKAAIANVHQAVTNLDKKLEAKIQQQITELKMTQADKTTQDEHTCKLEDIARKLGYLIDQMSQLIGKLLTQH